MEGLACSRSLQTIPVHAVPQIFFQSNDGFSPRPAQCEVGASSNTPWTCAGAHARNKIQPVNTNICSICKGGIWQSEAKFCVTRTPAPAY